MNTMNNFSQTPTRKGAQLPRVLRWFSSQCVLRQIDQADAPRIWNAVLHPAYERCWTGSIPHSEAEVAEFLHAATIAVVGQVPLAVLRHAVPAFPTRSEVCSSSLCSHTARPSQAAARPCAGCRLLAEPAPGESNDPIPCRPGGHTPPPLQPLA